MNESDADCPEKTEWWNLDALWAWAFTAVVLGVAVYQAVRYFVVPPQPGSDVSGSVPWLVGSWVIGLVLLFQALRQCCIEVVMSEDGQLHITRYYLHGAVHEQLKKDSVTPAEITVTKGDEGGRTYEARIRLPCNTDIVLGRHGNRAECAEACAKFNEALARLR